MLEELPANYSTAISIISVVVAGSGSLLYLLKRPHLTGDQKLAALMIGLAAGVPTGGLLAIVFMAAIFLPACSSGCHISTDSSYWMIIAPLSAATGIAIMVAASVADQRAQKAAEAENG